jgi:HSP20 family molecular chaperone IbpA
LLNRVADINSLKRRMNMTNALATYGYRPSLMGRNVFDNVFETVFDNWPTHVEQSTRGYPVADIYSDDESNTVLEFALAGFTKDELSITVQPDKKSITVSAQSADSQEHGSRRIARRSFTKTYVNYDNDLDLASIDASFENGLLRVKVPQRAEVKPIQVSIG